jgi:hypothetical protein
MGNYISTWLNRAKNWFSEPPAGSSAGVGGGGKPPETTGEIIVKFKTDGEAELAKPRSGVRSARRAVAGQKPTGC